LARDLKKKEGLRKKRSKRTQKMKNLVQDIDSGNIYEVGEDGEIKRLGAG